MKKYKIIAFLLAGILVIGLAGSPVVQAQPSYYGKYLCSYSGFTCLKVKRGDTWESLFPNERDREIVKRLNRTNMKVGYRTWIVVPNNLRQISNMDLSPFPLHMNTDGKRLIYVSLSKQAFGAYDASGQLVHWGPISGGRGYCVDTNQSGCNTVTGNFKVFRKQGPECISSKYPLETNGGAKMPYCMHFSGGFALHGSTLPGYNASHGCVRMFFDDAQWLNQHFINIGTPVRVVR